MPGFHHVAVVVRDVDASVEWYVRHLGFVRQHGFEFPGARAVFVSRGDARLELFQVAGAAAMAPEREAPATNLRIGGINHLALEVDDIERLVAELESVGVEIVSPPADVPGGSGARFAFLHDNERMLVELFQPA